MDEGGRDVIPNSLKLIAGRVGQEYNVGANKREYRDVNLVRPRLLERSRKDPILDGKKMGISQDNRFCREPNRLTFGLSGITSHRK